MNCNENCDNCSMNEWCVYAETEDQEAGWYALETKYNTQKGDNK